MLLEDAHVHRLTVEDVRRMYEAGVLVQGEDRVELIDGVLVDMTPPTPEHSAVVSRLNRTFVLALSDAYEVRVQDTLLVEGGFVEPDVLVADPVPRSALPSTAHLVIEVSVSTQRHDRAKADRYALAGVSEYWNLDLPGGVLAVHRHPRDGRYADVSRHGGDAVVRPLLGRPDVVMRELLGS